jgi:hypothetical protein
MWDLYVKQKRPQGQACNNAIFVKIPLSPPLPAFGREKIIEGGSLRLPLA